MRLIFVLPAVVVVGLGVSRTPLAQATDPRPEVERYLASAKFSAAEIASLQSGKVIARAESGSDARELVAQAAVKIRAPHADVLRYYGQMVTYVDGQVTLAFGKFSAPAVPADVAQLQFDPDEIDALKKCRPGDCDIRISGTALATLQSSLDRNAPDYASRINTLLRKAAIDYVTAYRARGDAALITFDDRDRPVSLRTEWSGVLANATGLHAFRPELARYLTRYPAETLPGARDIIYWIKENYGLKPVISIVHAVVYESPGQPGRTTVAQKYLYASHYYDASLAVASIVSGSEGGAPVTYLLYANRSRGDLLKGGFGGLKREVARSQARKAAEDTLGTIKQVLEGGRLLASKF